MEVRPPGNPPIHPDPQGSSYQAVLGHESHLCKAAVLAVIAIVAHEEVVAGGHYPVEVGGESIGRQHDHMLRVTETLLAQLGARKTEAAVVTTIGGQRYG